MADIFDDLEEEQRRKGSTAPRDVMASLSSQPEPKADIFDELQPDKPQGDEGDTSFTQPAGNVKKTPKSITTPSGEQAAGGDIFDTVAEKVGEATLDAARLATDPRFLADPVRTVLTETRPGKDVMAGALEAVADTGRGLEAAEAFARTKGKNLPVGDIGRRLAEKVEPVAKGLRPDNPNIGDEFLMSAGSSIPFIAFGLGAGAATGAAGAAAPAIAGVARGLGLAGSVLTEAVTEAGGVYKERMKEAEAAKAFTGDERGAAHLQEEAAKAAFGTFWKNALAIAVTNKLGGIFDQKKLGLMLDALRAAPFEGLQEVVQTAIAKSESREGFDIERDWPELLKSGVFGTVIGAGVGAGASMLAAPGLPAAPAASAVEPDVTPPAPEPEAPPSPVSPKAEAYLEQKFPELNQRVKAALPALPEAAVPELVKAATVAGEEALLKGAAPEEASRAAVDFFEQAVETIPAKPLNQRTAPDLPRPDNVATVPHALIDILPQKYQFREKTDPARARSIAENFDPTQDRPIVLRRVGDRYELLDGHHRILAAQFRGVDTNQAIIYENLSDEKALEIARRGNAQAVGYTALEEAAIFKKEVEAGKNTAQIGQDYGAKPRTYVESVLFLNNLSEELKQLMRDNVLDTKTGIALGRAVAEYGLPSEMQSEIFHRFIKEYDVTPTQLAYTMKVFGPKMMEQMDFFGQLEGTESRRGFVSVMKEILDQIRAQEKEATLLRRVTKMIEGYQKQGREGEIPKSVLQSYEDLKEMERKRMASIAQLQKDIGQKKLPSLKKVAVEAKKKLENQTKAELVATPEGPAAVVIPEGEPMPELPAGTASMDTEGGTLLFSLDKIEPETAEVKSQDGTTDEITDVDVANAMDALSGTVAAVQDFNLEARSSAEAKLRALENRNREIEDGKKKKGPKAPRGERAAIQKEWKAAKMEADRETEKWHRHIYHIYSIARARAAALHPDMPGWKLDSVYRNTQEAFFGRPRDENRDRPITAVIDEIIADQARAPRVPFQRRTWTEAQLQEFRAGAIEVPWRTMKAQIEPAYSSAQISEGKQPKTFVWGGKTYTSSGATFGSRHLETIIHAYELIPLAKFEGKTGKYSEMVSPENGYNGIVVPFQKQKYALGNRTKFRSEMPAKMDGDIEVRKGDHWTYSLTKHKGWTIEKEEQNAKHHPVVRFKIYNDEWELYIPTLPVEGPTTSQWDRLPSLQTIASFEDAKRYIDEEVEPDPSPRKAGASEPRASYGSLTKTPFFRGWFGNSKVVDENGEPLLVFHGTQRPDRINNRFRKSRATSGPMAMFTTDPEIGSKYATGKTDTSLEPPASYVEWFKFKPAGARSEVPIDRAWWALSPEQREKIAALAPRVGLSDDGSEFELKPEGHRSGPGGYDNDIREARGNHLAALVESWLSSGNLFNAEESFAEVLKLAGSPPMRFDDPHAKHPAVFAVYLSIQNPLETEAIPDEVVAALESAARRQRKAPQKYGADLWDKRTRDAANWIEELKKDRAAGKNSFVWSSIPDWVTDTLKSFGYDGIHDTGGKMGGDPHQVWIPFEETQVKSATGNRGTFDPSNTSIVKERAAQTYGANRPTFYSQLQKTIELRMPNVASPEQVKNIVNGQDVKKEEVEWSGILEYLDAWDEKTITKGDVFDFLKANEVKVEEVLHGDAPMQATVDALDALGWTVGFEDDVTGGEFASELHGPDGEEFQRDEFENVPEEIRPLVDQLWGDEKRTTKFDRYTLPGGQNYRELLFTLPARPANTEGWTAKKGQGDPASGPVWEVRNAAGRWIVGIPTATARTADDAIAQVAAGEYERVASPNFRSSHFSEPNILAHVRFNERTDNDGKRVLFIEELQSDWHQRGRDRGYGGTVRPLEPGFAAIQPVDGGWGIFSRNGVRLSPATFPSESEATAEATAQQNRFSPDARVPDAPFKKSWHELALKRMLRWAADNNFDRIAWTTGEQQAERYDLSKQVSEIKARKYPSNFDEADSPPRFSISVKFADGQTSTHAADESNLAEYVGKEMAEKINAQPIDMSVSGAPVSYKGLELKIGGEGMKGFYDKIIPSFLNKYTKKWGGRVSDVAFTATATGLQEPLTDWTVVESDGQFVVQHRDGEIEDTLDTRAEAQALADKKNGGRTDTVKAHALDITPEMRRSVTENGQPLFEKQMGLFGGIEGDVPAARRKDPAQPDLFSHVAKPQFPVPLSAFKPEGKAPRSRKPTQQALPDDSFHQVRARAIDIPGAIMETAVVDRLVDTGVLKMDKERVSTPADVAALFHFLKEEVVENVFSVGLDAKGNVLGVRHAGIGLIDQVLADPRSVLGPMRMLGAKQVVLIHNHPSGNPDPSDADVRMTSTYKQAARLLGMDVPYHVVIDGDKFGLIDSDLVVSTPSAPPAPKGNFTVPVVKPLQTGKGGPDFLNSPRAADAYVKKFLAPKGGIVALALDTQNSINGTWMVSETDPVDILKRVSDIALRNNARGIILVTDRPLPDADVVTLKRGLAMTSGAELMDYIEASGKRGMYKSWADQGKLRDTASPYSFREEGENYSDDPPEGVTPGQNAENRRIFNRKKIQVEILRAEIGIKEDDWLKMKLDHTSKNTLAEMNLGELDRMMAALRAMKRGKTAKPEPKRKTTDPEAVRKKLGIGDTAYKEIRRRMFGEQAAGARLTDDQKRAVIEKMREYPVDVRGRAILFDLPNAHGTTLDKKFAFEAGHYRDLTSYQRTFAETWRQMKMIDPSGHFKKISFDKMEKAVEEEMQVIESIRKRLAAVVGNIRPGSKASARIMRYGEGRFGTQYIFELRAKKLRMELALKHGEIDGKPLSDGQRAAIKDVLEETKKEIKGADEFNPAQVSQKEKDIDTYLRGLYDDLLTWQNSVRKKYGKPEIPRRQHYYTHIWEQNLIDMFLQGPTRDQSKTLPEADYTKPYAPFNPYELARRGGTGYKEDALGVFDVYLDTAAREALYRPVIAEIRQYVKHLPGRSAQAVDRWLNDMAGKTTFIDRANIIPDGVMRMGLRLANRAKGNLLVGNASFLITNLMGFATTVGDAGPRHTFAGVRCFLGPTWRSFAWSKCRLLQSRTNIFELDYSRHDALQRLIGGNFIEYFNVGSAFLAGYFKGKSVGLGEMDAITYGNDVARRTQADYRKHAVSPWMRSRTGKVLSMMQTYPFNLWHTVLYDYTKADSPNPELSRQENIMLGRKTRPQKMGHLFALLLGVMAANWLKEHVSGRKAFDIRSFLPNILWAPPWLLASAITNPRRQARDFSDPFYFRGIEAVATTIRAIHMPDEKDDKEWAKARRELTELAFILGPKYGGLQLKRFLEGHLFPPVKEEPQDENRGGARPAAVRQSGPRDARVREALIR